MRTVILSLIGISLSYGYRLSVCTDSPPSSASIITIANSVNFLRKYNIETIDVSLYKKSKADHYNVNTKVMCSGGFRTSANGKGNTLKEACDISRKTVIRYLRNKREHMPRDKLLNQCYLINDLR